MALRVVFHVWLAAVLSQHHAGCSESGSSSVRRQNPPAQRKGSVLHVRFVWSKQRKNLGFAKSKYPATWTKTGALQEKSHGAATHRVIDGWTLWNAAQKEGGNRAKGKSVFTSGGLLMTRVIAWSGRGRPSRGNVPVQVQLLHWDLQLLRFMGRSTGNDVGWKKCM